MSVTNEVFEGLTSTATSDTEVRLIEEYITSEKLKDWLTTTKEGMAISKRLIEIHEKAHDAFAKCEVGDIESLNKAKMELEISKRLFSVFSSVIQQGDIAEARLSGEIEQ